MMRRLEVRLDEGMRSTDKRYGCLFVPPGYCSRAVPHGRIASIAVVVGLCLLLSGCAARGKTPALTNVPFELNGWKFAHSDGYQITTEHYEIYTTLTDRVLVDALPQALESAYRFYHELAPNAREPKQRMPMYLFARRGEWANFTRRFGPRLSQTLLKVRQGGYTQQGVVVAEYVTHAVTFPLMAHEGFHQFLYYCAYPRVPAWLNEGLAVYCEGQRWTADGLAEFDPWLNPQRRNMLAELILRKELFSLDELLRMNAGHVVGGSSYKISAYYGQVWALMLFLREGQEGKYAEGFQRLLAALGRDDIETYARAYHAQVGGEAYNFGRDLFCNFISNDLATVEREYRQFMNDRILGDEPAKKKRR